MNSSDTGEVAHLESQAAYKRAGYTVLDPLGHEQAYDFVAESGGEFRRVQVKSGRMDGGSIDVHVCTYTGGSARTYADDEIEDFAVYVPDIDHVYVVPVEEAPQQNMCLRVEETNAANASRVRWSEDYRWENQL